MAVTLSEEHRPQMLENKVLKIFALKRDGGRLHEKTSWFIHLTKYY